MTDIGETPETTREAAAAIVRANHAGLAAMAREWCRGGVGRGCVVVAGNTLELEYLAYRTQESIDLIRDDAIPELFARVAPGPDRKAVLNRLEFYDPDVQFIALVILGPFAHSFTVALDVVLDADD